MRCSAASSFAFFAILYVGVNAWSAVDIFVLGRFEEKWGGPLDNLLLGLQLSAAAFLLCALGCFLSVLVFTRWRLAMQGKACWLVGVVAAAVGLALLASGLFPWFEEVLPLVEGVADMALAFILVGVLSGLAGAAAVSLLKGRRLVT